VPHAPCDPRPGHRLSRTPPLLIHASKNAAAFFPSSCYPTGSNRSPKTRADYSATENAPIDVPDYIKKMYTSIFSVLKKIFPVFSQKISHAEIFSEKTMTKISRIFPPASRKNTE
jgi:hypothetical protein